MPGVQGTPHFAGYFYINRKDDAFDKHVLDIAYKASKVPKKPAEKPESRRNSVVSEIGLSRTSSTESLPDRFMLSQHSNDKQIGLFAFGDEGEKLLRKALNKNGILYEFSFWPKSSENEKDLALEKAHEENHELEEKIDKLQAKIQQLKNRNIFNRLFHRGK